jgi:hypothetical protein
MRHATKLWTILAVAAIGFYALPVSAATPSGSIKGFIVDGSGKPLAGAAVMVLATSEEVKSGKVVRRAKTDAEGKFVAADIQPGQYRVKAAAVGFKPVVIATEVRPNKVTVFDSILMRRIGTIAEETELNGDSRYARRGARGTIFHMEEDKKPVETAADATVALTDRAPELHGVVHTFTQTSAGSSGEGSSFLGANFAISEQITRDTSLVFSGQMGYGEGAPQRFEVLTTTHAGNNHRLSVALGYARFTFSRKSALPKLGQFSVSATDTWQVSGPVLVVYGANFSRFAEGASGTSLMPRFEIAVDALPRTRLFAGLVPGSSSDIQSSVNLESGEIEFAEPKPVAASDPLVPDSAPRPERSYRLQFGAEHALSDRSSVEMMAFFDTVSGHGVGLLAIPNDIEADPVLRGVEQRGRTRGLRVVYHRRVNDVIDGAVGYSFGEGQQFDDRGASDPSGLFSNRTFHVFSAKIDANFVRTGTRVSTVLRLAPEKAVFAIDPFQGQIATYDPNLSLSFVQQLPSAGFLPGQWQAIVDLRNLFDQQASVSDDRQELLASRFNRIIRIGVSLRF